MHSKVSDDFILQCICGRAMTQAQAGSLYSEAIECSECFAAIRLKDRCYHCHTTTSLVHNEAKGTMDICSDCTKTHLHATMQYPRFLRKKQQATFLKMFTSQKFADMTVLAIGKDDAKKLVLPSLYKGKATPKAEQLSHEFKCHRIVLASISPGFRQKVMPSDGSLPTEVTLDDISPVTFDCIVRYAYMNDPKVTPTKILPLMGACQTYGIEALEELCEELLEQVYLTPDNLCSVLSAIFENGLGKACSMMLRKFMKNYSDYSLAIVKTPSFNDMCLAALQFFLELDHVQIREEKIWMFVTGWAQHQSGEERADRCAADDSKEPEKHGINDYDGADPIRPGSRRFFLQPLVEYMRFGLMDAKYFINNVIPENVLSNEQIITCLQYFHAPDMGCGEFFVDPRSTTLGTKLIEERIVAVRGEFSRAGVENQWTYSGEEKDAVAFSTDTTMMLEAIGVFCGKGKTTIQGWVYRGDNGEPAEDCKDEAIGHVVATTAKTDFDLLEPNIEPLKLLLPNLLKIYRNVKYTIEILQKNSLGEKSSWVRYSKQVVCTEAGVTFKWKNARYSPNRTDMLDGAIPCVYGYTIEGVTMDDDIDPDSIKSDGFLPASVWRGEVDEKPSWTCTGKVKDSICICMDKQVTLEGIGVFCGAQKTVVQCKLFKGRSHAEKDCLATTEESYQRESPNSVPIQLSFKEGVDLDKDQIYTVEVLQTNAKTKRCCRVTKGEESVTFAEGPFTVKFSEAKDSANGTDVKSGSIPTLYFKYSHEVWLADAGTKGPIDLVRGTFLPPTAWRWHYEGKKDAMKLEVDGEMSLLGVGVFCGEGVTTAKACLLKGDANSEEFGDGAIMAESDEKQLTHTGASTDVVRLPFAKAFTLKPGIEYTLELLQQNATGKKSAFVFGSKQKIKVSGVNFFLSDAKYSPNGSDDSEGAFPFIMVRAGQGAAESEASVMDRLEPIVVKRGDYGSADWRWKYRGGPDKRDAVMFECDKAFFLRGVGVFCGKGTTRCQVKVVKGPNKEGTMLEYVAQSAECSYTHSSKQNEATELKLETPLMCEPGTKYTVEVHQTNDGANESFFITNCKRSLTVDGFTFEFSNADYSPNGTDANEGAIPTFYIIDPKMLGESMASVLALGAVGAQIVVKRGLWEEATWRWNYTGSVSAVKVKVDQKCVLEGVGVFPGSGLTKVKIRVIEGDNSSSASSSDSRVVGSCEETEFTETSKCPEPKMCALSKPCVLEKGKEYTIEVVQTNAADQISFFVQSGKSRVEIEGVTVEFMRATYSPNGTDVGEGAIPTLYLRKTTAAKIEKSVDLKKGVSRTTPAQFMLKRGVFREAGMRWEYDGEKVDAICVCVDKSVTLYGIGVFVGGKETENEVIVYKGDNSATEAECSERIVSRSSKLTYKRTASNLEPIEAALNPPFSMEANEKYTIEVRQTNAAREASCFFQLGTGCLSQEGVAFTFSNALHSTNGSCVGEGAIPALYWSPFGVSLEPWLAGDFTFARGESDGEFGWTHSGTKDAIGFEASHGFDLHGIGIYLPTEGPCTAMVRVVAGENDEDNSAEVLASVGPREISGATHSDRTEAYRLDFLEPLAIAPKTLYTIELQQTNLSGESCHVSMGTATINKEGLSIRFSAAGFSPNGSGVDDGAFPLLFCSRVGDPKAPSAPKATAVDLDNTVPCICGADMVRVCARQSYGSDSGIGCDKCRATVGGHFVVYHCPAGRTSEHRGGYDYCMDCAMATVQQMADKPKGMFTLTRGKVSEASRWAFTGPSKRDAIAFRSDRAFVLRGVGTFLGGNGRTEAQLFVYKGDNDEDASGGSIVGESEKVVESRGTAPKVPFEVKLKKAILIEALTKYTVEMRQQNMGDSSHFASMCSATTVEPGVCKVSWEPAKVSNNGTDASSGAIPCLYCLPPDAFEAEAEEDEKEEKVETASDNPNDTSLFDDEFVIARGKVSDAFDWEYDGDEDNALFFTANYDVKLHGIGVFLPRDGDAKVEVNLYRDGRNIGGSGEKTLSAATIVADKLQPLKLALSESIALKGGVKYELVLKQHNLTEAPSASIDEGVAVASRRGVEVTFEDSSRSIAGTNVGWGAIPALYVTKTGTVKVEVESASEKKAKAEAVATASADASEAMKSELEKAATGKVVCQCGEEMVHIPASDAYSGRGIGCDGCGKPCSGPAMVYHCPKGSVPAHDGGFDYCDACGGKAKSGGGMPTGISALFSLFSGMGLRMDATAPSGPPPAGDAPPTDEPTTDEPTTDERAAAISMFTSIRRTSIEAVPPVAAPPPEAGATWACAVCTFENPGHAHQCEMCFTARP